MHPLTYLLLLIAITAVAAGLNLVRELRGRKALCAMARQWGMHYVHCDRLRMGRRVAAAIPDCDCDSVRVRHVLFRSDAGRHEFLFTVDFLHGAARQRRAIRVASCQEAMSRGAAQEAVFQFAPPELPPRQAYEHLRANLKSPA